MTFVVCPNLAIDRLLTAASLSPGELTRCRALHQQAGGKGANVARALRTLRRDEVERPCGGDSLLGFAAGQTGGLFAGLANEEGLAVVLVPCPGETRVSTVLLTDNGDVTRLFERGPVVTEPDEAALVAAVTARPPAPGEWAIIDGAVPPGASADFYAVICAALRSTGYSVLVDAAGDQLAGCLATGPDLVKVNFGEACSAVGTPKGLCEDEECLSGAELEAEGLELCHRLVRGGAGGAAVTLGAAGAVALIDGEPWHARTPAIRARNSVGSGDCFAAALVAAFEREEPVKAALAMAAGVAAANAASPLTAHFDLELARRLADLAYVGPPAP
jgi:1-phosphofructokinase family hexose kinase